MLGQPSSAASRAHLPSRVLRLLDALFPLECLSCLENAAERSQLGFCDGCLPGLAFNSGWRCWRCDLSECQCQRYQALDARRGLIHYEAAGEFLLRAIKRAHHLAYWESLGGITLEDPWLQAVLPRIDACVPIPQDWSRRRQRGYNHASLLIRGMGQGPSRLLHTTSRASGRQKSKNFADRWNSLFERYACSESVQGARLLVVDDLSTTGATLEAAAHALKAQGALEVYGLTAFIRKPTRFFRDLEDARVDKFFPSRFGGKRTVQNGAST